MSTRRNLSESDLKSMLDRELEDSIGYVGSEITKDRAKALDYYYGRKVGVLKAQDGRSSVVSRDVLETVEWATAQLMQMFEGEQVVQFDPEDQEDIANAEQETDYINFVLQKDNNGFQLIHDWIKDGLLSRVGIVHVGWDGDPKIRIESYTGLLEEQLLQLLSGDDTELVEKSVVPVTVDGQTVETFDVRVRFEQKRGRVVVGGIPPEEFRISRGVRSIEEVLKKEGALVAHVFEADRDKLKALKFSPSQIESIMGSDDERQNVDESLARDNPADTSTDTRDKADHRTTWVSRCFMKVDWDSDGKAELREIIYAGKEIASNEPAEEIPYADWCPVPMPHRFSGQSYADLVLDLQDIRTSLTRGSLDNLYLANNPMKEVVDSQVNLKDLLNTRIGGVVRVKSAGNIREIVTTPQLGPSLQMMEYADTQRENRTGLTRYNQGLDAETLNKTAKGMNQILSQSQIRLRLVARLFAERGMKRLFRLMHGIVRRHQDFVRVVKLRNTFVPVDPREWRERENLTPTVGLGTGSRQEQIDSVMQMLNMQLGMLSGGLPFVTPQNVFHALGKLTELQGYKDVPNWWTDPAQAAQQPPKPDPEMAKVQGQMQIEQAKIQAKTQGDMQKLQMQHQLKLQEIAARERTEGIELQADREDANRDYALQVQKLQVQQQQFREKQAQDAILKREQMRVDVMASTTDRGIEDVAVRSLQ